MTDSSTASPFTYTGPREVLVNTPVVLTGTFNRNLVSKLDAMAEDRFSLPITLNGAEGTWRIALPQGFNQSGARWFTLKALMVDGKEVKSAINFTVTSNANTVGQPLRVTVLRDTLFKATTADSSSLNSQQKVTVRQGQSFEVNRYGLVDGHLRVDLKTPIPPIGTTGFFFQGFVQLQRGDTIVPAVETPPPTTPVNLPQLNITQNTWLKARPVDSSLLSTNQKTLVNQGQTYPIVGYACISGHFRVSLPNGRQLFVFKDHAQVVKDGKVMPFNADAITLTVTTSTLIKRQPIDSSQLQARDRAELPTGNVYSVLAYKPAPNKHLLVTLGESIPGYGNTGFVLEQHVLLQRGATRIDPSPSEVILNVPYLSQRDNPRKPWATCNVTSIAMVLAYYGVRSRNSGQQLEDELYGWCINRYGENSQTDNAVLAQLIKAYGFPRSSFSTTRTWAAVRAEIDAGRPVVIGGYFTHGGHIVTLIGYNDKGYLIHDPWGDALSGYENTEGRRLLYPTAYMNDVVGLDGEVWAHFIVR